MSLEINNEEGAENVVLPEPDRVTVHLERHIVLIRADAMTQTPTEAYDHELPILYEVHGEDRVEIAEGKSKIITIEDFSVDEEYDRLVRRYALSQKKEAVRDIYGADPAKLAEELNIKYRRSRGAKRATVLAASLEVDNTLPEDQNKGPAVDATARTAKPKKGATDPAAKAAKKVAAKKTTRR